ncbi:MAG: permease, partial [Verrucomicrobiota bacterium]
MNWFSFNSGDFAVAFLSVLLEGIPFPLVGSLISGVVDAFVSPERLTRILPRNPFAAVVLSGALGLIFPMCECGSVVVIRRFLRKGLPVGCAVSYMLGAPIVSPIVALSTYAAFRGQNPLEMTCLRLGMGFCIAVVVGLIIQQLPSRAILQP